MSDRDKFILEMVGVTVLVLAGGWASKWLSDKARVRMMKKQIEFLIDRAESDRKNDVG